MKLSLPNIYRPQTKFAKVMFSQVSVCPRGRGCLPHCMLGYIPQDQRQTPPQEPEADTPPGTRGRHPPAGPPGRHPPVQTHPSVHAGTRSTSGRYASHWNASLFEFFTAAKEVAGSYNVFIRVFLSVSSQGTSHVTITHDALHLTIKETPPIPVKGPAPPPRTGTPLALATQKSSNLSNLDLTAQGPLSPCYVQTCSTWTSL